MFTLRCSSKSANNLETSYTVRLTVGGAIRPPAVI